MGDLVEIIPVLKEQAKDNDPQDGCRSISPGNPGSNLTQAKLIFYKYY